MDLSGLPGPARSLMSALAGLLAKREPAIRAQVHQLRAEHPELDEGQLAQLLIRRTRRVLAGTAAATGAAAIAPGLGTALAIGGATSQTLFALEREAELVMAIAITYGHELAGSDERILEALVVVGIAGGAVKLRENLLVAGGQRITVEAFRRVPVAFMGRAGGHLFGRIIARATATRAFGAIATGAPLVVGMAAGAGFDWLTVTALGRAAVRYYGPGGPAARVPVLHRAAVPAQDPIHVEAGD